MNPQPEPRAPASTGTSPETGATSPSPAPFRYLLRPSGRERWLVLALAVAVVAAVLLLVDLTPKVESDFFFASDAPELRSAARVDALFPSRPQILLAVGGDVRSSAYEDAIDRLTNQLSSVEGVVTARSITSGPSTPEAARSGPFWSRLLAPEGSGLTYVVVEVADNLPPESVTAIEELADGVTRAGRADRAGRAGRAGRTGRAGDTEVSVALSGVPYVVERIRRALLRDLRVFSGAAVVVFGLVVALLYRDRWIVAGVLATCLSACAATLALLSLSGLAIGVLTANIVTIVFVLTLSHLIYLTANTRRLGALGPALVVTGEASFWCMVTTLAGFVSLLFASAEPLRELGKAGALGTLVALAAAYGLYPPFLRTARRPDRAPDSAADRDPADRDPFGGRKMGGLVAAVACLAAVAAFGLPRITTDPGLLAYFDAGSPIHAGLRVVDTSGGSSPLRVLFRDGEGGRLDTDDALARLGSVQRILEADDAVGTVLSLAPLVDEAARAPLASLMGTRRLVDMLASPTFGGAARAFVTTDRELGLVFLRMREGHVDGDRGRRDAAVDRVRSAFAEHGFEVEAVAGLYQLQGELADLVATSLLTGVGGLILLFVLVAWAVTRERRSAAAMLACLAGTPIFLFGTLGLAGLPVDFISSPAANVALSVGIDSMIHLAAAARRARGEGLAPWAAWVAARARLARPIAGAGLILAAGFGLFVLSSFPPTRRFGIGVVVGIVAATALTLVVVPWLATIGGKKDACGM